jgi:hypothetical protein
MRTTHTIENGTDRHNTIRRRLSKLLPWTASAAIGPSCSAQPPAELSNVRPPKDASWWYVARSRLLSFGLILVQAFLLMVSLVSSAVLAVLESDVGGLWQDAAVLLSAAGQPEQQAEGGNWGGDSDAHPLAQGAPWRDLSGPPKRPDRCRGPSRPATLGSRRLPTRSTTSHPFPAELQPGPKCQCQNELRRLRQPSCSGYRCH